MSSLHIKQSPPPTSSGASALPPPPPTITTRTTIQRGNTRVRLTPAEKAHLLRLCILHQRDHRHGNKKAFWVKIRGLLKEQVGKELRDPQQTVDALVRLAEGRERERKVLIAAFPNGP